MMQRSFFAAALLAALAPACAPGGSPGAPAETDASSTDVVAAPGAMITAVVSIDGALLSDDPASPGATCEVGLGTELDVSLFRDGAFRVVKPASCTSLPGEVAWAAAPALAIGAGAYAGLTEVVTNSAISVAMNYAGDEIFCTAGACLIRAPLYAQNRCFLRDGAAKALQNVAIQLRRRRGTAWKLRALDCYRPAYVQERMWELVPDPQWVAKLDRAAGNFSRHNRGLAIDLTLEEAGAPADMGSGFDEFTPRSQFDADGLSAEQRADRALLRELMTGAGFKPYDGEWWHFSWAGSDEALDLPL
jgi:D-alanyl-D-alanine dipeptidase